MEISGQHHHGGRTLFKKGASPCGGSGAPPSLLGSSPSSSSPLAILQSIPEDSEVFENGTTAIEEDEDDDPQMFLLALANKERTARGLPALRESCYLNWVAAQHATRMAQQSSSNHHRRNNGGACFHSVDNIGQLQRLLQAPLVGENVQMGEAPPADNKNCGWSTPLTNMHWETMHHPTDQHRMNRATLLAPCFAEFGSGVAVAASGTVFTCQLFRTTKVASCHSPALTTATATTTQPECTVSPNSTYLRSKEMGG